jgi:quercetin dioxygenase-like cupin family protein
MQDRLATFRQQALADGHETVLERIWPPREVVDTHTHPFAVRALVTAGEMWLTVDGATRHLLPGDAFSLSAEQPHAERYGPAGATYWAARHNA